MHTNSKLPPKHPKVLIQDLHSPKALKTLSPSRATSPKKYKPKNTLSINYPVLTKTLTPRPSSNTKASSPDKKTVKNSENHRSKPSAVCAKRTKSEQKRNSTKKPEDFLSHFQQTGQNFHQNPLELNKTLKKRPKILSRKQSGGIVKLLTNKPAKKVRKSKSKQKNIKVSTKGFICPALLTQIQSAIKIQAVFRGYLTRKVLKTISNFYKNLALPSSQSSALQSPSPYPSQLSLSSIQHSIHILPSCFEPPTPPDLTKSSDPTNLSHELSEILQKKAKIQQLKLEDLKTIEELAQHFHYQREVIQMLFKVTERRYQKLENFFDQWVERLKENLKYLRKIKDSNNLTVRKSFSSIAKARISASDLLNSVKCPFTVEENSQSSKEFSKNIETSSVCFSRTSKPSQSSWEPSHDPLTFPLTPNYINTQNLLLEEIPQHCSTAPHKVNPAQGLSSLTIEHSEALKDYSSISLFPGADHINELSSLESELSLKPTQVRRTVPLTIFEHDSPSNPLLLTSYSERPYDTSGENLVVDRVMFMLELSLFHEYIEDLTTLFEDTQFILKLTEEFLLKNISLAIGEALRPRVLRASTVPAVQNDTENLLKTVDQVFVSILNDSAMFRDKLENALSKWKGIWDGGQGIFKKPIKKMDAYSEVHNKAIFDTCEELLLRHPVFSKSWMFESMLGKVAKVKFSDIFIDIRDKLVDINEIRAGNLPFGETIRPNGELDEVKLAMKQKQSLHNLIVEDIHAGEPDWVNYVREDEQIVVELENTILSNLLSEVFF